MNILRDSDNYKSDDYISGKNNNRLKVFGKGSVSVKPDAAEVVIGVITENIKLQAAQEENKKFIVLGDYDKLKQVFINLISNGIKFTNINGIVWINIASDINSVIIQIKDSGIGIKKEDLPFIFERMYRTDKSRHKIDGTGIGLTLVKRILALHDATIDVESKENKGTTFTVCIRKNSKII